MDRLCRIAAAMCLLLWGVSAGAQITLVELNCENLFDCRHDSLKDDTEWLPGSLRRWTPGKYRRKLRHTAQTLLSCQGDTLPALIALVEIENDRVARDLVRQSMLWKAGYRYLMTESPDTRGIDVALLYRKEQFRVICYDLLEVRPLEGMRPTRDILYVRGVTADCDTLHVFVVHAPSRYGGERHSRPFRLHVVSRLAAALADLPPGAAVVVAGDFNDYADGHTLRLLERHGLRNVTASATGLYGRAKGTYRYRGLWGSIDHVLVSPSLLPQVDRAYVNDHDFLLEEDTRYGGWKPRRTYNGMRYQDGFSDHLPLVVRLRQRACPPF